MNSLIRNGRKALMLTATAGVLALSWSFSAQAQDCTTANWSDVVGAVSVGTQSGTNRRYGGPCGARIQANADNYLVDNSPVAESAYIARFYAFLNNLNGPAIIFAGRDDVEDLIQVWYNFPAANDITLRVFPEGVGAPVDLTAANVGTGWHSIELVWSAGADADIRLAVNSTEAAALVNTTGLAITTAQLGLVNGAEVGVTGSADFDDFDSRRISRPGRLCRGLTDEGRSALDFDDVLAIFGEIASGGGDVAGGQPDYNEDGAIDFDDVLDVFGRIASGNDDCSANL